MLRHAGKCAYRLLETFLPVLMGNEDPLGNSVGDLWASLRASGDILGNAQVKVEICWAHCLPCLGVLVDCLKTKNPQAKYLTNRKVKLKQMRQYL